MSAFSTFTDLTAPLSRDELDLLEWLAGPGIGRRTECPQLPLRGLINKGLARLTGNGRVHVTELGHRTLAEIQRETVPSANHPEIPDSSVVSKSGTAADEIFWRSVIADLCRKPSYPLPTVNPDRSSFDAWR
jgi:hypothetical protein